MLALRLIIFRARPVLDGRNNPGDRHVKARDQLQRQGRQQHDHRADPADDQLQQLRQKSRENARVASVQASVPEIGEHGDRPRRALLAADQLDQRADRHSQQKAACYAQHDGPSVMQQQNQKAHHKRKRQYVKPRTDQALKQRDQKRQQRALDAETAQDCAKRQYQTDPRADLPANGFCAFCLCPGAF